MKGIFCIFLNFNLKKKKSILTNLNQNESFFFNEKNKPSSKIGVYLHAGVLSDNRFHRSYND